MVGLCWFRRLRSGWSKPQLQILYYLQPFVITSVIDTPPLKSDQDGRVFSRIMCLPGCALLGVVWSRKAINPFSQGAVLMGSAPSIIIMIRSGAMIQAMHLFAPSRPIGA